MTTIVIGLAAVVVLILVVVLLAMRYLRADDGEDFDDMPAERIRPRSAPAVGDAPTARYRQPAGQRPARGPRPQRGRDDQPRRPAGDRGQRPARDYDERSGRHDPGDYGERDYTDARSRQRSAGKYDDRRGADSAARRQDSLPDVRPRQARGKRTDDGGDWPSTEWDDLSDVDYWAEVASDKPLTTTAQPAAPARPAAAEVNRGAEFRPGQGGREGALPQRDPAARPVARGQRPPAPPAGRPAAAPLAAAPPAAGRPPSALPAAGRPAAVPQAGGRPAAARPAPRMPEFIPAPVAAVRAQPPAEQRPLPAQRSEPSVAMPVGFGSGPRPAVADDDPLTSPSFPKVPASDSRSYRSGRADTPPSGSRSQARYNAPTQQLAAYAPPAGQFDGYGGAGQRDAAQASGYSHPGPPADPTNPQAYRPAPAPPAPGSYHGHRDQAGRPAGQGGYQAGHLPAAENTAPPASPAAQSAPSGNPYGSYVSAPTHGAPPASRPAGQPNTAIPSAYGGYPAVPDHGQRASYQPPPARSEFPPVPGGPGGHRYPEHSAGPAASYPSVPRQPAGYPSGRPDPLGYLPAAYPVGPRDASGYTSSDPYGPDPYDGYPGYGAADQ